TAVRLLPGRPAHDGCGLVGQDPETIGCRHRLGNDRKRGPMRHLPPDTRSHSPRRQWREERIDAMKTITKSLDRRSFIKVSALAGGGVLIGLYTEPELLSQQRGAPPAPTPVNPSTYITVHPDNTFTIIAKNPETGQGIRTALPMVIAEEFDVDWKQGKIQQGDLDPKYGREMGASNAGQSEGGSSATPQNYAHHRSVGAPGPMMMI